MAGVSTAFVTWNNPREIITYKHNEDGTVVEDENGNPVVLSSTPTIYAAMSDQEICDTVLNLWINSKEGRKGAVTCCRSAAGLHHLHMVLQVGNTDSERFTYQQVQKIYGVKFHLEPVKGSKKEALDYIYKRGKWEEKGEVILAKSEYGELADTKGKRSDLNTLEEMLRDGKTPKEIFASNIAFRRYEKMIKAAYTDMKVASTPDFRDVIVYWHVGESETGKSRSIKALYDDSDIGRDKVYRVVEYESGYMDYYMCEPVLWLDELRPESIKYATLLSFLDGYVAQIHARYANVYALWSQVHITSVYPPEFFYELSVPLQRRRIDSFKQLQRRINYVVYHYLENGEMMQKVIPMEQYTNYSAVRRSVLSDSLPSGSFEKAADKEVEYIQQTIFPEKK